MPFKHGDQTPLDTLRPDKAQNLCPAPRAPEFGLKTGGSLRLVGQSVYMRYKLLIYSVTHSQLGKKKKWGKLRKTLQADVLVNPCVLMRLYHFSVEPRIQKDWVGERGRGEGIRDFRRGN